MNLHAHYRPASDPDRVWQSRLDAQMAALARKRRNERLVTFWVEALGFAAMLAIVVWFFMDADTQALFQFLGGR